MAVNYSTITEADFSSGMDSTTAESNLKETFVQDLQNAIPDSGGSLATRTGYITFGGSIPLRVVTAEAITATKVRLSLDSSITVANLSRQPVIVYGTSTAIKDDSIWTYFPKSTTDIPVVVPPYDTNPSQADIILEQYKTSISQKYVLMGISLTSLGTSVNSYLTLGTDNIKVDPSDFTVTARIVNNTSSSKYFFLYYIDPDVTGEAYHTAEFASGSSTWTTTASTVPNNNFLIRCYKADGTNIMPDSLSFDDTTSIITADFSTDPGDGHMVVVSGETSDFFDAVVLPNAVTTLNVQRDIAGDVLFVECYKKGLSDNVYTLVCPDDIQFDTSADYPLTVTFTNVSSDSYTVRIIWRKGEQAARSVITVEYPAAHGIPIGTLDYSPQLAVYGPDHAFIYSEGAGTRQGWVSFVDRYRTATEDRMVCGLGWNTFQCFSDTDTLDGISLPEADWKLYPNLRSRAVALGTIYIGPALSNGLPRTSDNIDSVDVSSTGTLLATAIRQSGTTLTFTTTLTGGTLTGNASDLGRTVTIIQAPTNDFIGEFEIQRIATTDVAGALTSIEFDIILEKGSILDYSRFDGSIVEWGIYTDEVEVEAPSMLIPGDKVELYGYATTYPNTYCLSAYTDTGDNFISLSNITVRKQIPNRMLLLGTRITNLIPLRPEFDDDAIDENLWIVPGDMIQIDDIVTEERVRVVTSFTDITLTEPPVVVVSGGQKVVEVTIEGGVTFDCNIFKIGDYILLSNAGTFSGEYQIASILSDTKFLTAAKSTTAASGTYLPNDTLLKGGLIEIWGEPVSVTDDAFNQSEVKVVRRWVPVDRPNVLGTYGTSVKQFSESDYTEQPFIRSIVARDSLFETNGIDPVYKFDGRNFTVTGLPRVNPCAIVSLSYHPDIAKIPFPTLVASPSAGGPGSSNSIFHAFAGSTAGFEIGDPVFIYNGSDDVYTGSKITKINRIEVGGELVDLVEVVPAFHYPDSGDILMRPAAITYKYYFKYLFIDRNNNVIQSATLGSEDVVVAISQAARVQFRLIGLPMVLPLDYARMEIEIYRTKKNGSAPFYRIRNVEVPYPVLNYIDIYDSTDDALLTDLDYNTTALTSQELSSGLNLPPKAACLTSASNRLLLGACTSTPSFTLTVADGQTANATTAADYIDAKLEIKSCDGLSGYVFQFTDSKVQTGTGLAPIRHTTAIIHASDVATVTCTDVSSATVGDWVYLTMAATGVDSSPTMSPRYAGWHKIISVNATGNKYTFSVNSDAINSLDDSTDYYYANEVNTAVHIPGGIIPVYVGLDDKYFDTVEGNSSIPQIKNMPILGRAINTVMALESEDSFWAEYGNDITPLGTIIVKNVCDTFQVKWTKPPAATGAARIFINGGQISGSGSGFVDALTTFRGSRIVKSYPGYVECFDNPDAENASTSDSIIDVNPADGEIITAMIPLIGPSTTTSSQLQGTVIVFKEKSIYAVDVEKNSFEKLETNGVGAAYPNSVSHTSGGLAFATSSGVFKIDRSLRVSKISTPIDKDLKAAQTTDISRLQGHGFPAGNQYKLSLSDNNVLVYNYDREIENKPGAWCEYTNHPVAGGWATNGANEFFASTLGRVFINRTSGTVKDYRDDSNTPIAFNVTFRATHFGDASIRKQIRHVNIGFRNTDTESVATAVSCGFECSTQFTTLDTFTIETTAASSISQLRFGIPSGRVNYIQMRVQNSAIDEPIEITGITYKVAGLKIAGTEEAKSTK